MNEHDLTLTNAAFAQARRLDMIYGDEIPWTAIEQGFELASEKVFIANRARGIFKPRQMSQGLLSIKTTEPRAGRTNIYADHETDEGYFRYSLQRGDPKASGNKHLWEALEFRTPFIYFHAVAEGVYKAIWPCFVAAIHADQGFCEVVVGHTSAMDSETTAVEYQLPDSPAQRYSVRETKVRLHQATFRKNVLTAYKHRCAISGLPIARLLDAAHITPDSDSASSTDVSNGISMSRLHHQAFDSNLLGISPDFEILLSDRILSSNDGPLLQALHSCHKARLNVPVQKGAQPDASKLARRFEIFLEFNL